MPTFSKILVPVDFSGSSKAALEYACDIAETYGATLEILHLCGAPQFVGMTSLRRVSEEERTKIAREARKEHEKKLQDFVGDLNDKLQEIPHSVHTEWAGDLTSLVVEYAEKESFDLIVMGTHGRKGVREFFLGSNAKKILTKAPCPVLTVRK